MNLLCIAPILLAMVGDFCLPQGDFVSTQGYWDFTVSVQTFTRVVIPDCGGCDATYIITVYDDDNNVAMRHIWRPLPAPCNTSSIDTFIVPVPNTDKDRLGFVFHTCGPCEMEVPNDPALLGLTIDKSFNFS
jgi:hypothetical protein